MSALGRLVASLVLDTAEFTKGTDKAQYEAARAASVIDKRFKELESSIASSLKTIGGALTAGFSVNALIEFAKHSFESADQLGKLAQKAGMATEEFSKWAYVAKLSDVTNESLLKGVKGLSEQMVKATDATSKESQVMKALGVDIKGGVSEALSQLADTFAALPDGATKGTLAVTVFGKAGMDMIPLLNQGSAGIAKLKEEAEKLGLVMGEESAKAAEKFNDNMKALNSSSEKLGMTFVNDVAPTVAKVTDHLKDAYIEGGKLHALWVLMGAAGTAVFTDDMLSQSQKLNKEINSLAKEFDRLYNKQQEIKAAGGFGETLRDFFGGTDRMNTAINQVTARLSDLRLERTVSMETEKKAQTVAAAWKQYYADEAKLREESTRALLAGDGAKKKAAADKADADKAAKKSLDEYVKSAMDALAMDEAIAKGVTDLQDKRKDAILATEKNIEQIEFETTLLGLSNVERQTAIALRALETSGITKQDAAYEELARRMKLAISTQETAREGMAEMQRQAGLWDSLSSSAGNFFGDLIVNGKSAFDSLKQSLKSFAADIIAFFAKRYILSMVAGASGTFGATAANAASGALGGMGNSLIGAGASAAGSWLGSAAGGGAVTGGFTSGVAAGWAGSPYAGAGALAELGSVVGQAANFLVTNPVGWIALAAIAAYAVFAQKKGGDKDSGAGSYSIGADGNITANALTDANRFYRADSHGMDSMVSPIVEATAKSFAAYAKIFGITDLATFVQSTDTDPRGTAPNRAATQAYLNGGLVFSANNADLGRDAAALTPELQLQASRALLAAFQASNLQADLATLLGSVVAASAPQAAIDALFAQATDLSGVLKALGETKVPDLTLDSLRLLQQAGESLGQTFTRVAQDFLNAQGALNQAIAGRNPVFARNLTLTARNDIATQFLAGMGQELSTAWLERMALDPASFTGLNTASMSLLAQFLNLQTQLEQLDAQLAIGGSGVVPTLISGLGAAGNAALDYARSLADARGSLADYLRGSLLSNLSPLSLTQKYDESQSQLQRLIGLATGGDIGAMGQIGGARDSFLSLSQQRFGFSPTYNSDFFRTFDQTNALTNNAATRPMTAADAQAQTTQIIAALTLNNDATTQQTGFVAQLLDLIKAGISVNDPEVLALLQQIKNSSPTGGAVAAATGAI